MRSCRPGSLSVRLARCLSGSLCRCTRARVREGVEGYGYKGEDEATERKANSRGGGERGEEEGARKTIM